VKKVLPALIAFCACGRAGDFRPLRVGDAAPPYAARTLAGDSLALDSVRGRAVLLNVWATWCTPCRQEMPAIERLFAAFADSGLTVIGVSVDDAGSAAEVRQFVAAHHIRFTIALDPDKRVARVFRTLGVPETFLLDRRGLVVRRWIGEFDPGSEAVRAAVRQALGG